MNLLFVSGNIAYVDGAIPAYASDGKNDVQDQTKIVMESIGRILKAAGYDFDDALKVSVFLSDIKHYSAFNEIYGNYWKAMQNHRHARHLKLPHCLAANPVPRCYLKYH